ncbi:UNVERIFIED_CONTAM: hypothetical protein K2H54_051935 [Gekko kuhli]
MPNRKRRRSSSDIAELKDGKQQKIDKFVSNTQSGAIHLSNRYAVLEADSQVLPGEEDRNILAETNKQQHCCQLLPTLIMELFSKEAVLTSQSLAILFEKINAISVKVNSLEEVVKNFVVSRPTGEKSKGKLDASPPNKKQGLRSVPEPSSLECNKRRKIKPETTPKLSPCNNKHTEMGTQDGLEKTYALPVSHDSNSHIRPQDEYLVAEVPHRQKPINCQKWVTHEMDLDLRSHQVVTMSLGAPTNAKSLALELWEAEVEQARAQQSQSIFMDGMSKEAEGSLILPTSSADWEQLPHSMDKRRPEILVQQGAEGDPLVPPHQGGMLDNSIEDVLFTMFEDLTPQEQQAVTERLEHTKNCLLARKVPDLSEQQASRGDATVNSNSHPSMQVPLAPQLFPPIDVEMTTEQSGTGTSAAITDSPQMPKNGSVFFDRDRSLNHITEFD